MHLLVPFFFMNGHPYTPLHFIEMIFPLVLDRDISLEEIAVWVRKLKNNGGLVGELLKYGGLGMIEFPHQLFEVIWSEEFVPPQWREGLIVDMFKKGDKEEPGNYKGITALMHSF